MIKININKGKAIEPNKASSANKSVTIVIDKEWQDPDSKGLTGAAFYKELDRQFNDQAMQIAEALQGSLPGGTWDRLVGIMVRRHATYLVVNRDELDKSKEV